MDQSACAAIAESRRPGKARRQAYVRRRQARTTRPHPWRAARSRRAGSGAERREVSPLIDLVERVRVVSRISSIDLDLAMPGQQRRKRLVDQRRVCEARTRPARAVKQLPVNSGTDPHTVHAIIVPLLCHVRPKQAATLDAQPPAVTRHVATPVATATQSTTSNPSSRPHGVTIWMPREASTQPVRG